MGNKQVSRTQVERVGRIEVREATTVDDNLIDAMGRLIPQLSSSNPPPDVDALRAIVSSECSILLLAVDPDVDSGHAGKVGRVGEAKILGSMTLALFRIPTGLRAWIEDVVVDDAARGQGVGEALSRAAIDRAREAGATTIDLTSRPSRAAANRLYERLGFNERATNVYRLSLSLEV
ncbi:MAG: GNAT family N-acetyltransferase [Acidimicrobiales bacterium]|nr:GNAT family N-acetyltransferase [Acidimicrobiales bacterium]